MAMDESAVFSSKQRALAIVRAERGLNLQSQHVIRTFGKRPATMRRSLKALVARDILREEETQGRVRYRLEEPFLSV